MTRKVNSIAQLAQKPGKLFLVDSLGALLTAFLLFVVLRNLQSYFGMPEHILNSLSAVAAGFCVYSAACFFLEARRAIFMRAIAVVNLFYCMLMLVLMGVYYSLLTSFGILYFLLEIALIGGLVYLELRVAAEMHKSETPS